MAVRKILTGKVEGKMSEKINSPKQKRKKFLRQNKGKIMKKP